MDIFWAFDFAGAGGENRQLGSTTIDAPISENTRLLAACHRK